MNRDESGRTEFLRTTGIVGHSFGNLVFFLSLVSGVMSP